MDLCCVIRTQYTTNKQECTLKRHWHAYYKQFQPHKMIVPSGEVVLSWKFRDRDYSLTTFQLLADIMLPLLCCDACLFSFSSSLWWWMKGGGCGQHYSWRCRPYCHRYHLPHSCVPLHLLTMNIHTRYSSWPHPHAPLTAAKGLAVLVFLFLGLLTNPGKSSSSSSLIAFFLPLTLITLASCCSLLSALDDMVVSFDEAGFLGVLYLEAMRFI